MNGNAAYHTDAAGTNLAGITFPVKVTDASVLNNNADKYKQVTDSTSEQSLLPTKVRQARILIQEKMH